MYVLCRSVFKFLYDVIVVNIAVYFYKYIYILCSQHFQQSVDQPCMATNPARGQLNNRTSIALARAYWLIVVSNPLGLGLATNSGCVFLFNFYMPITLTPSLSPSKNSHL